MRQTHLLGKSRALTEILSFVSLTILQTQDVNTSWAHEPVNASSSTLKSLNATSKTLLKCSSWKCQLAHVGETNNPLAWFVFLPMDLMLHNTEKTTVSKYHRWSKREQRLPNIDFFIKDTYQDLSNEEPQFCPLPLLTGLNCKARGRRKSDASYSFSLPTPTMMSGGTSDFRDCNFATARTTLHNIELHNRILAPTSFPLLCSIIAHEHLFTIAWASLHDRINISVRSHYHSLENCLHTIVLAILLSARARHCYHSTFSDLC